MIAIKIVAALALLAVLAVAAGLAWVMIKTDNGG
jgi:hypothetical protein